MTAKELRWFRTANAAGSANRFTGFYAFKSRFLRANGTFLGYARQFIEKECWTCHGSGRFTGYSHPVDCRKCNGSGVYDIGIHYLEVYQLGPDTYHIPMEHGVFQALQLPKPVFIQEINGRIKHEMVSLTQADRCYLRLLLRFEPANYYWTIMGRIKARVNHFSYKWRWRLMVLRNKLDFFKPIPVKDEVPF